MGTRLGTVLAQYDGVCRNEGQEHSVLELGLGSQTNEPGVGADDEC